LLDNRPPAGSLSITAGNGRLRKERQKVLANGRGSDAILESAIGFRGRRFVGPADGDVGRPFPPRCQSRRPPADVEKYRAALVKQLLTPARDVASVKWKQMALARGQHRYTDVKPERIDRAIADDLAFLAAHPVRQSNRRRQS